MMIKDRYEEYVYIKKRNLREGVYTIIEVDNEKGIRISAVDSDTQKTLIDARLNNQLQLQHLEALV